VQPAPHALRVSVVPAQQLLRTLNSVELKVGGQLTPAAAPLAWHLLESQ
jgi:hypothetical protein